MPFSMLLNIVGSSNAKTKDILWKFIKKFHKEIDPNKYKILDELTNYAINYFKDEVEPKKKFKKPNAKGFGALKRDSSIKKNYEKVTKEFIDTESALIRDKDLQTVVTVQGDVVPFNRKQILNKIEETLGRGDLQFGTGVQDGKEVVIISQKILVD